MIAKLNRNQLRLTKILQIQSLERANSHRGLGMAGTSRKHTAGKRPNVNRVRVESTAESCGSEVPGLLLDL
jgi:hypothetical protein